MNRNSALTRPTIKASEKLRDYLTGYLAGKHLRKLVTNKLHTAWISDKISNIVWTKTRFQTFNKNNILVEIIHSIIMCSHIKNLFLLSYTFTVTSIYVYARNLSILVWPPSKIVYKCTIHKKNNRMIITQKIFRRTPRTAHLKPCQGKNN